MSCLSVVTVEQAAIKYRERYVVASKDYTGVKFGKLTAIKVVGRVTAGKKKYNIWLCKCDCGRKTEENQSYLISGNKIRACKVCRRGPCVVCGIPITDKSFSVLRNTCSDLCRKERINQKLRIWKSKKAYEDPDYYGKKYQAELDRHPDFYQHRYQKEKRRLLESSEKEQLLTRKKQRQANARYYKKTKETDSVKHEERLRKERIRRRKHKQSEEIAKLQRIGQNLADIKDKQEEDTAE